MMRVSSEKIIEFIQGRRLTLAVPDIHGAVELLRHVEQVLLRCERPVVFLGDYVDCRHEGSDYSSIQTIEHLCGLKSRHPDWVFLVGNHEQMLLQTLAEPLEEGEVDHTCSELPAWKEYEMAGGVPAHHLEFLQSLRSYYLTPGCLYVHGGIPPGWSTVAQMDLEQLPVGALQWTRRIDPDWRGPRIVRGHDEIGAPTEYRTHISLETMGWERGREFSIGVIDDQSDSPERRLVASIRIRNDSSEFWSVTTGELY